MYFLYLSWYLSQWKSICQQLLSSPVLRQNTRPEEPDLINSISYDDYDNDDVTTDLSDDNFDNSEEYRGLSRDMQEETVEDQQSLAR